MNYYVLPKINIDNLEIEIQYNNVLIPHISHSCDIFLHKLNKQLNEITKEELDTLSLYVNQISSINHFKISKIDNINYDMVEIFNLFNRHEMTKVNDILIVSLQDIEISNTLTFLGYSSKNILLQNLNISNITTKFDFIIFDELSKNINHSIKKFILYLNFILKNLNSNGICIIKIENTFHKSILDIIYILCSMFEKNAIFKPLCSNNINNEKYLILKKFKYNELTILKLLSNLERIVETICIDTNTNSENNIFISSIIKKNIPYHFLNKIEEINVIFCQQQLETIDQIINLSKNKHKEDKIKVLKINNIQKCIQWCEKYDVPHNKIIEKPNIFIVGSSNTTSTDS
jgi:23S rRNA U2552 (ribose-2'-O)-methylase RlmE/FtsJ